MNADIYAHNLMLMVDGPAEAESRASLENPSTSIANPAAWLMEAFGAVPTIAGPMVSERTALNCTAVYACVRILAETVASLPLGVYERLEPRGKKQAPEHPAHRLLHDEPNPDMTSLVFRETLMSHAVLWGNAYAVINWSGAGEPIELIPIEPHRVKVGRGPDRRKVYQVSGVNGTEIIGDRHMIHVPGLGYDGLVGYSVIQMLRQACGLALAAEEFGARFFSNGANMGGVLEHPNALGDKALENLRQSWMARSGGLANAHKPAILEEGMQWKQTSIPPEDAQFLETRKFQTTEFARAFRVPPHMLADLDKATFSNIEHQGLEFEKHSIRRWLVAFEQEFNRKLFLPSERRRYYAEHNVNGLLRGDVKSRYDAYAVGRQNGWLSANDIRERENENPIDGGDVYLVNGNMMPAEQAGRPAPSDPPSQDPKERIRSMLPVFLDAFERVARREAEVLGKAARKPETFDAAQAQFFAGHGEYVRNLLTPAAEVCGLNVAAIAERYLQLRSAQLTAAAGQGKLTEALNTWSIETDKFEQLLGEA